MMGECLDKYYCWVQFYKLKLLGELVFQHLWNNETAENGFLKNYLRMKISFVRSP